MQKKELKILAISQVYYPDTASVSQHLTDLLEALSKKGHDVTVYSSIRDYENPKKIFSKKQIVNNVKIHRIKNTGFGKKNKISRLSDFITFNLLIFIKLLFVTKNRFDIIVGMTSPPLLSYIGLKIARFKNIKFVYWTMDLQPELSIVANYIKPNSKVALLLQSRGDYIFKFSDKIIALDSLMEKHILNRTEKLNNKIDIIPVWPVINKLFIGDRLNNPFRIKNNFKDKIVIMYSGNHSVMHPLTTLLEAAVVLRNDQRFLFVHVGGGVRLKEVLEYKEKYNLQNVITLPYQPRENIHISLGSADIQVVSLGEDCTGFTHPNKIYGSMFIGKPILYIGPTHSHISEILNKCDGNISVKHGDVDFLVEKLDKFPNISYENRHLIGENNKIFAHKNFHPTKLIKKMVDSIESVVS
jgi:glycosyltransferase involved in cell wall biosynthesis